MSNMPSLDVKSLVNKMLPEIKKALPSHLDGERLARIILTEARKIPALMECSQDSFLACVMVSAQLGLEPGPLGHCYYIPYGREATFILGYKGMIDLARRSGQIISLQAHAVFENDEFRFSYGLNEQLHHVPKMESRGKFIAAYALAKLRDGGHQFVVMFKDEIEKARSSSKAAKSQYSPWNTHYEEMAKKTAVRRLFKMLPVSIEIQRAVSYDEASEYGKMRVIDGDVVIEALDSNGGSKNEEDKRDAIADIMGKENEASENDLQ